MQQYAKVPQMTKFGYKYFEKQSTVQNLHIRIYSAQSLNRPLFPDSRRHSSSALEKAELFLAIFKHPI